MTYISRKSKIIVSRWLDECDAEYWLKASKKRSDGRLKRFNSCDDFRAWINNNCVKNEHFVDLMSNGENSTAGNEGIFGRFVPVPILFKLLQQPATNRLQQSNNGEKFYVSQNSNEATQLRYSGSEYKNESIDGNLLNEENFVENDEYVENAEPIKKNDSDLSLILCENFLLERRLLKCTNLLSKAIGKLEKIDEIVCLVRCESENARNEQILEPFNASRSRTFHNYSSGNQWNTNQQNSSVLSSSNSYLRKLKESAKFKQLARKISCLKKKLKKVNEHQQETNLEIQDWQKKLMYTCSTQMSDLCYYQTQEYINYVNNNLRKKLERLVAEKGRILAELCQAVSCSNSMKKNSKSNVLWRKKSPCMSGNEEDCRGEGSEKYSCTCCFQSSDNHMSSEYDEITTSIEDTYVRDAFNIVNQQNEEPEKLTSISTGNLLLSQSSHPTQIIAPRNPINLGNSESKNFNNFLKNDFAHEKGFESKENVSQTFVDKTIKFKSEENPKKNKKTSRPKFVCPESDCKKKSFKNYESFLNFNPKQEPYVNGYKEVMNYYSNYNRPNTSPTTRAEKLEKTLNENMNPMKNIPRRRVKSETTMKEIEKALRNYEDRLENFDDLEYKIEDLKHKLISAYKCQKKWAKQKHEERKLRAAERENSNKVITQLCSQNWELKRQVHELTMKFESQCKKIQDLSFKRARELENETEVLKKELTEYQNGYENQRKCISEWESVVAEQKTEIEKLTNHIRNLSAMKNSPCQQLWMDSKQAHRSRSFSPDSTKGTRSVRQKTLARLKISSEEDTDVCCCNSCQPGNIMCYQLRNHQRACSPPPPRSRIKCCINQRYPISNY